MLSISILLPKRAVLDTKLNVAIIERDVAFAVHVSVSRGNHKVTGNVFNVYSQFSDENENHIL